MMLKPLMDIHKPNILTFLGAQERYDVQKEYWIVTEYHEVGSLSDFLHKHTLVSSWLTLLFDQGLTRVRINQFAYRHSLNY